MEKGKSKRKQGPVKAEPQGGGAAGAAKKKRNPIQDIVFPANDFLNREGFVRSSKDGNKITSDSYIKRKGTYGNYRVAEKNTILGAGGRRETTTTSRYSISPNRQLLNNGDVEIYGYNRTKPVVTEVQNNRGSGTRKTGAKKKSY